MVTSQSGSPAVSWKKRLMFRLMRFYPPYLGAGIRIRYVSPQLDQIDVDMPLRLWNRNYVGTHFGGSLYSMCDPFYMLILFEQLGRDFIVWDKAATIRFRRPGKGTVKATFRIPLEEVERIRHEAFQADKVEPIFKTVVTDAQDKVVAEVEKVLYVRRKRQ